MGTLGHTVSVDLEAEINHVTKSPVTTLNTEAQMTYLVGNIPGILSHRDARTVMCPDPWGEENRSSVFGTSLNAVLCFLPQLILICIFPCNNLQSDNSFQ